MTISIEFGAMVPSIKQQLEKQGIDLPEPFATRFEEIAWSITFLHLQNIIPDSVRDKSREKLMKNIVSELRKMSNK